MMNENPPTLTQEEISAIKDSLREYLSSSYSLQDGIRQLSDANVSKYNEEYFEAIESEDVDKLERLAEKLDNWVAYINEKDRSEGNNTRELHGKLLAWIDAILAR